MIICLCVGFKSGASPGLKVHSAFRLYSFSRVTLQASAYKISRMCPIPASDALSDPVATWTPRLLKLSKKVTQAPLAVMFQGFLHISTTGPYSFKFAKGMNAEVEIVHLLVDT